MQLPVTIFDTKKLWRPLFLPWKVLAVSLTAVSLQDLLLTAALARKRAYTPAAAATKKAPLTKTVEFFLSFLGLRVKRWAAVLLI